MVTDAAIKSLRAQRDKVDAIKYGQITLIVQAGKIIRIEYLESQLMENAN